MTSVVVPLQALTADALLSQAHVARARGADSVELRLDLALAAGADAEALLSAIPRLALPAILTVRHASEGGAWQGDLESREALFTRADRAGAAWIDCEAALDRGWRPVRAKLILSAHDFHGMLDGDAAALGARLARMHASGAAVAKLALTPADGADLETIRRAQSAARAPAVVLGMGEHGLATRLLAGVWGAAFTWARLDGDEGSAPGQPTLSELGLYQLKRQSPATQIYGVVGSPVSHSLSPLVHNAAFAHLGLDAVYVPLRCEDVVAFWRACSGWLEGLSVTIPHKQALLAEVDECEPPVRALGTLNTIYRSDTGATVGANTDAPAIVRCLEVACGTLDQRRVLILGAGGVARTAARACAERGARVILSNRTPERAVALAAEVGCRSVPWAEAPGTAFDILVNGTSVGMGMRSSDESPWPAQAHRRGSVVFDTVYVPLETRLLRDAHAAGATTVCGLDMFISQAMSQFERWTALPAPEHLMYRLALERLDPAGETTRHRRSTTGSS